MFSCSPSSLLYCLARANQEVVEEEEEEEEDEVAVVVVGGDGLEDLPILQGRCAFGISIMNLLLHTINATTKK